MKTLQERKRHYLRLAISKQSDFAELIGRVVKKDYNILTIKEWLGVVKVKCKQQGLCLRDVLDRSKGKNGTSKGFSAKELHDICEGIVKGDFS